MRYFYSFTSFARGGTIASDVTENIVRPLEKTWKVPAFPKVDDSPQVDDSALQNNGLEKDDFSDDDEENEDNMVLRSGKRVKFA